MSSSDEIQTPRIIIVGAGLAGISAAIRIKKELGYEKFTILERATAIGGTWRDNTYPGCGSDVPGHWYSLSTELNPDWSSYYVSQPEIRAYWEKLYEKYNLPSHTMFGQNVKLAKWDSEAQRYEVVVEEVATSKEVVLHAEIMIYAVGGFHDPVYPNITGMDQFRGLMWHSARWQHDVDLKGKRVGVIGNGCSAAQLIPQISTDSSVQVVNFCRTPQWLIPQGNYHYSRRVQWVFRHVPLVMRWYRNLLMTRSDFAFLIFRKDNRLLLSLMKRVFSRYIRIKAPKDQVAALTPTYPPGCKRIIVDPGYLKSLRRPNVTVEWDGIRGFAEDGIELESGKTVPLDVVVFSTGYSIETNIAVQGSKKMTAKEYFATQGGPTAYLGTCIPGFPNLFVLLGPNVATGHASVIFSQESQIGLALQLIKPILARKAKSFEVKEEASNKYNTWLQSRLSQSVWTDCNSYYQVGGQKQTKIIATFPGPVSLFWWLTLRPRWNDFIGVGAEAWERELRHRDTFKKAGITLVLLILAVNLGAWMQGKPLLALLREVRSLAVV